MNDISPLTFEQPFLNFLKRVNSDATLERDWVDLLSQLEYVGCRKIIKAIAFHEVTTEILRHIAEEASHAYLLKRVVDPKGDSGATWEQGRFCAAGWRYFQRLDHGVCAIDPSAALRYPGVAWAIERRVLTLYPVMLELSQNESLTRALKQIIGQERRHGNLFNSVTFPEGYREKVIQLEAILWKDFERELTSSVALNAN